MQLHRCRVCGETFLGTDTPSHCPFCGAHREYFVDTRDYPEDLNEVQITEVEREDLLAAIELERANTRFYLALAGNRDNLKLASAYKRLAKVEAEHASLFCKLAGVSKPFDLLEPGHAADDWCVNIADSRAREQRATALYALFASRATNERIGEVFSAISDVEADHIVVDSIADSIAGC